MIYLQRLKDSFTKFLKYVHPIYGTKMEYTEDFYFTAVENVLYWHRMAFKWLCFESQEGHKWPFKGHERQVLHGKIKIRGLVNFSGVLSFTQL